MPIIAGRIGVTPEELLSEFARDSDHITNTAKLFETVRYVRRDALKH